MAARVDRDTNTVEVRCDKCAVNAPPAEEIIAGGGLVAMGWYCSGGVHICPHHEHPAGGWPHRPSLGVLKAGGRGTE